MGRVLRREGMGLTGAGCARGAFWATKVYVLPHPATQAFEVIESIVKRLGLRIRRSEVRILLGTPLNQPRGPPAICMVCSCASLAQFRLPGQHLDERNPVFFEIPYLILCHRLKIRPQ